MDPPTPSPELINFCLQPLVELSSTAVSADSHPLSNLVSINPSIRSRGFRVEHFIRPPVQLDFEFRQVPVNVACIIVQPDLAPHSEMRLELAASFHTASTCSNLVKICPNMVVKDNQTLLLLENKAFKRRDGKVFSISKADLTSCQVEGSFMSQSVLSRTLGTGAVAVQPLKHPNILSKLKQLRLTVTRMTGPKPLALKSLEVLGSPSMDSCTSSSQLNCLWTCLAAVGRERSRASSEDVKLYCSKNSSPQQGQVASEQDKVNVDDLHKANADSNQVCSCARDQETMSSHEQNISPVECGCLGPQECHCEWPRGPVFGGAGTHTQEVGHIKELTSENKKSLKPQQRAACAHLHGCSHNIGKGKQKPGPSSSSSSKDVGSCRSGSHRGWLEGRNGSPPSTTSLQHQHPPNHHNTSSRDHNESIVSQQSPCSCGLWTNASNKAAIDECKQQLLKDAQTLPASGNHYHHHCREEIPCGEFLDKITYEVMQIPMLLPSGHCVDRSTVEKLANNDALYGRPPTDPFTGIPFSGTSKPAFFPELKLRLDRFLSSRAEDTASSLQPGTASARTLGTADQIAAHLCRVGHTGGGGGGGGGDGGRRSRGDTGAAEEVLSSQGPPPKKWRSMTTKDASYGNHDFVRDVGTQDRQFPIEQRKFPSLAAPDGSGSHNVSSVRTGSDAVWACPTTGSPSYGRGSPGSAIKDQSTTHRMPHHDHSTSSSSTQPNHSFQQARNQFEEEVAGSLDQALKQLFS